MTSSIPHYLTKAPSLNNIILGTRASTFEFEGNKIQSTALIEKLACFYTKIMVLGFDIHDKDIVKCCSVVSAISKLG